LVTGTVRIDPLFQAKIAGADDFHISPFREAGVTYGTPTWIWSVAVEEALYVRAYNGQNFVGMTLHSGRKPGGSSPPA
jgi:hypothetical protein